MDIQTVYDLFFQDVYRYALALSRNKSVAEEITQETFFKALSALDQFDGKCKISVWLCQIAKNTYISMHRRDKFHAENVNLDTLPAYGNPEDTIADQEMVSAICKILNRLEEPYKEVFSLRIFGGLSFRKIAELFGKTESWARVTYHRARMKIKEELK